MPSFHDVPQGDMYIEYSVVMPTEISDDTRNSKSTSFSAASVYILTGISGLIDIFGSTIGTIHDEL